METGTGSKDRELLEFLTFVTLGIRVGRLWPRKWLLLPLSPSFKD